MGEYNMEAIFEITADRLQALPQKELNNQIRCALEMRTELLSRQRLPGTWKTVDYLRRVPHASETALKKRRGRTQVWAVVCLMLGTLAFLAGTAEPKDFLMTVIGAVSICLSFFHLMGGRKKQKESFTEPARQMLDSLFALPETVTLRAYFSIGEMILEDITSGTAENRRLIPCEAFECAVETDGLYLLAYAGKGIILPKNCLTDGTDERFRAFLNSRTIVADLTARPADNS